LLALISLQLCHFMTLALNTLALQRVATERVDRRREMHSQPRLNVEEQLG